MVETCPSSQPCGYDATGCGWVTRKLEDSFTVHGLLHHQILRDGGEGSGRLKDFLNGLLHGKHFPGIHGLPSVLLLRLENAFHGKAMPFINEMKEKRL